MMPFTTDDGPATVCLVVRSWQQRLDFSQALFVSSSRPAIPSHLLCCRGHLKRGLTEAEPIRQTDPSRNDEERQEKPRYLQGKEERARQDSNLRPCDS